MGTVMERTTPNARRAKAADTRARIFQAAAKLFSEHGYQVTTVDRIATLAGVAKGTFFLHFKSKDAVIAELVRFQTRAARKARGSALAQHGPIEALRATVIALGHLGAMSRALSRGVITAALDSQEVGGRATQLFDEVLADMMSDARAAKKAGLLGRNVDPETLARSLLVGYLGAVLSFATSGNEELMPLLEPVVDSHLAAATANAKKGVA